MFCTNCGAKNKVGAKFCYKCGKNLVNEEVSSNDNSNENDHGSEPTKKQYVYSNGNITYNESQYISRKNSLLLFWTDIVNFNKRMGRADYWTSVTLWNATSFFLLMFLATRPYIWNGIVPFVWIYSLIISIGTISAGVRRLHDTGRSGAMFLIQLIPVIGSIIFIIFVAMPSVQVNNIYANDEPNTPKNSDTSSMTTAITVSILSTVVLICVGTAVAFNKYNNYYSDDTATYSSTDDDDNYYYDYDEDE